ncbi:hypothetical protein J6590_078721 [Homalodisca vitripennis]|nr:hypothetical protein J6590_078721 [Homalodisca vitripennis]
MLIETINHDSSCSDNDVWLDAKAKQKRLITTVAALTMTSGLTPRQNKYLVSYSACLRKS